MFEGHDTTANALVGFYTIQQNIVDAIFNEKEDIEQQVNMIRLTIFFEQVGLEIILLSEILYQGDSLTLSPVAVVDRKLAETKKCDEYTLPNGSSI